MTHQNASYEAEQKMQEEFTRIVKEFVAVREEHGGKMIPTESIIRSCLFKALCDAGLEKSRYVAVEKNGYTLLVPNT